MPLALRIVLGAGALASLFNAAWIALKLWMVLRHGTWTVRRQPVRRAEEPGRYWMWMGINLVVLLISLVGVVVLATVALQG